MYNLKDHLKDLYPSRKMGVGFHEKAQVTDIVIEPDYFEIQYDKQGGEYANNRFYFPTPDKVWKNDGETPAQAVERKSKQIIDHIVKHLSCFYDEDEIATMSAPSLRATVEMFREKVLLKNKTHFVNLKLVPSKDGQWANFGSYPNYIEPWKEGKKCGLYFTKYEKNLIEELETKNQILDETQEEGSPASDLI